MAKSDVSAENNADFADREVSMSIKVYAGRIGGPNLGVGIRSEMGVRVLSILVLTDVRYVVLTGWQRYVA